MRDPKVRQPSLSPTRIITPADGQQFAPGDTVTIVVEILPAVIANDVAVSMPGLSRHSPENRTRSRYEVSYVIPDWYAGPLTIEPEIWDLSNTLIVGAAITIAVRPTTPPLELFLPKQHFIIDAPPPATAQLYVTGTYASGVGRDLSSSAAGTTFQSSNPDVLIVDVNGNVQALTRGTAVVTVDNGDVKASAVFVVEDPADPLPPQAIPNIGFTCSDPVLDSNTGHFVQDLLITYPAPGLFPPGSPPPPPVVGPFYMVISGLASEVFVVNKSGSTKDIPLLGSPYYALGTADGLTLTPGETISVRLEYLNQNRRDIVFTPSLYRTLAEP